MKVPRWALSLSFVCSSAFSVRLAAQKPDPQIPDSVRADIIESLITEFREKSVKNINLQECQRHLERENLREGIKKCDTHADVYVTEKDFEDLRKLTNGSYAGVGMLMEQTPSKRLKVYPFPNSPAARAGVQDEDIILQVDSTAIDSTKTSEEVRDMIRGMPGSYVSILFERNGAPLPSSIIIERQSVTFPLVAAASLEDSILYIYISRFSEKLTQELQTALHNLHASSGFQLRDARGIIIDLRFNPGGRVNVAVKIAEDLFAPAAGNTVVSLYEKNGTTVFATKGRGSMIGTPTVVLVNSSSASASELLAGTLQEWGVATIVGDTTFKKGSAQVLSMFYITPRTNTRIALRLTMAEYRVGNTQRRVDGIGIIPDYVIDDSVMIKLVKENVLDLITFDFPPKRVPDPSKDPQLKKALEVLFRKP